MSSSLVLYVDASEALAGDIFVAALLDLGLELDTLRQKLTHLKLDDFEVHSESVLRGPFRAVHFSVVPTTPSTEGHTHTHAGHHLHAHSQPTFDQHPHRRWTEVQQILEGSRSGLGNAVVDQALQIFECLASAEARVHGVEIESVHFHEVGAVDSIVDIVSVCICLELLGVTHIVSSPIPLSQGRIRTEHGPISLPAPATVELLKGWPVQAGRSGFEQVTPTGAAIVRALAQPGPIPTMLLQGTGVGAGTADPDEWPNILRVMLGETQPDQQTLSPTQVDILSAHMDDLTGEHLPGLIQALLDAGAVDAFASPILMKKGRSGLWVQALVAPEQTDAVSEALLAHGSSFGLRRTRAQREVLDRWHESVDTPFGPIRIKVGSRHGHVLHASPEFEDIQSAAKQVGVPIPRVHSAAVAAWNLRHTDTK